MKPPFLLPLPPKGETRPPFHPLSSPRSFPPSARSRRHRHTRGGGKNEEEEEEEPSQELEEGRGGGGKSLRPLSEPSSGVSRFATHCALYGAARARREVGKGRGDFMAVAPNAHLSHAGFEKWWGTDRVEHCACTKTHVQSVEGLVESRLVPGISHHVSLSYEWWCASEKQGCPLIVENTCPTDCIKKKQTDNR